MSSLCQALGGASYGSLARPSASRVTGSSSIPRSAPSSRSFRRTIVTPSHSKAPFSLHPGAGWRGVYRSVGAYDLRDKRAAGSVGAYYGEAPAMAGGSTQMPPTVEWDARNTNAVTIIGHCGADPELREFGNGNCVANVNLALRGRKSPMGAVEGGGETTEADTHWVEVEAWGEEARQLAEHVRKGRQIMVTGRLKENKWVDKVTGMNRSKLRVTLNTFAFVAPYSGAGGGGAMGAAYGAAATMAADPYSSAQTQMQQTQIPQGAGYASSADPTPVTPAASYGGGGGGGGGEKDDLWRDLINNPDGWWDNRERKSAPGGNPRYPDFKSKDENQTPLWIDSRDTPSWAVEALNGASGGMGAVGAASGAAMASAGSGADYADPYYASGASGGAADYGEADYSQPYGGDAAADYGAPGVAYEPAKPFDDDEPPF